MRVKYEQAVDLLSKKLIKYNVLENHAKFSARLFVENSLYGVYSHGFNRFAKIISYIKDGYIIPNNEPKVLKRMGVVEQWDGNLGLGNINAAKAMRRACELAHEYNCGVVALKNTNHWLRAGAYTMQAANDGFIGICFTNTIANMAPYGGVDLKIGNNPISISIPKSNQKHIVLDMAMSQFSYGRIEDAILKEQQLPVAGGYDENGNLTSDPKLISKSNRVLPIGFWKGSGLSLVLDLVAAILSGGDATVDLGKKDAEFGISQVFIALNPYANQSLTKVDEVVTKIINDYKATKLDKNVSEIFYPGEMEVRMKEEQLKEGIFVVDKVWEAINKL